VNRVNDILNIALRPIEQHEFAGYQAYFVDDYGREIASNYSRGLEDSLAQATDELGKNFPGGRPSPNNYLLCIEEPQDDVALLIGYLWYSLHSDHKAAFIQDFYVFDSYRGKGYGKASMAILESTLCERGVTQIKLRVAHSNLRAQKLYRELGFDITGVNMAKIIGG